MQRAAHAALLPQLTTLAGRQPISRLAGFAAGQRYS